MIVLKILLCLLFAYTIKTIKLASIVIINSFVQASNVTPLS